MEGIIIAAIILGLTCGFKVKIYKFEFEFKGIFYIMLKGFL